METLFWAVLVAFVAGTVGYLLGYIHAQEMEDDDVRY